MDTVRRTCVALVILASVALLAGCSSAAVPPTAPITVTDAWARSSSATAGAAAAYATITNAGTTADALVGASSPAAASVEVHETMAMGSPSASIGGMMGMQPVARVEIPAGGSLELKPGGYHAMLIDLTLTFEKAGARGLQAALTSPRKGA